MRHLLIILYAPSLCQILLGGFVYTEISHLQLVYASWFKGLFNCTFGLKLGYSRSLNGYFAIKQPLGSSPSPMSKILSDLFHPWGEHIFMCKCAPPVETQNLALGALLISWVASDSLLSGCTSAQLTVNVAYEPVSAGTGQPQVFNLSVDIRKI